MLSNTAYSYLIGEEALALNVGAYSTHVFDFNVVVGIIFFIVLVVMLVYWIHKRK